jgi:hypothetical protein
MPRSVGEDFKLGHYPLAAKHGCSRLRLEIGFNHTKRVLVILFNIDQTEAIGLYPKEGLERKYPPDKPSFANSSRWSTS